MRMVKFEELPYHIFATMRRAILETIPFAIINTEYDKDLKDGTAFFYFWDMCYIPEEWYPYIVQPPADREPLEKLLKGTMEAWKEYDKGTNPT